MTYDPFQTYAALGPYTGIGNPFQTPFTSMQTSATNPAAAWNPLIANGFSQSVSPGQQGYPGMPIANGIGQAWQITPQTALWQNPLLQTGFQNGYAQSPFVHPLAAQHAAYHLAAQQLAQHLLAQQFAAQQLAAQQLGMQTLLGNQQNGMYSPLGQIGMGGQSISPLGQTGVPLAPQSWVGPAGQQQSGVPANPILLAHLTARALQAQGLNPGIGFQV